LPRRQYILFPYKVNDETAQLLAWDVISTRYPKTVQYLQANKYRLETRESGKFADKNWYRFGRSQNLGIQSRVKVCVPRLVFPLLATLDAGGTHFLDNVDVGGVTLKADTTGFDLRYILVLLNSQLFRWYFPFLSPPFRGGYRSANRQFLGQLPITRIETQKQKKLIEKR
jgi:hypothetical protein